MPTEQPPEITGTWEEPKKKRIHDLGYGYTLETIAEITSTEVCEGFLAPPQYERWQLSRSGDPVHTWETPTETRTPAELWRTIEQHLLPDVSTDDGAVWSMRNTFLRQWTATAAAANAELAKRIWERGTMLEYLCSSCAEAHVGDDTAIRAMILSFAATYIHNSDGIHISISGPAGTGKSHAVSTVAKRLPQDAVLQARLSDKAMYYHEVRSGTVISMDDQELTEDFQELLKVASTNWSTEARYWTVQNGKPAELKLPARCPFWICKANLNGDEQVLDRQLIIWTDDSVVQKRAIQDALMRKAADPDEEEEERDIGVCRALWASVLAETVVIPFADKIGCDAQMDPRNIKLMLAMVQAHAILRTPVRERDARGRIVAIEDDFRDTCLIINPLLGNKGGSQKLKLSSAGAKVLEYLATQSSGNVKFSELRRECKLSQSSLSQALYGRADCQTDGLMAVCPAIEIVTLSVTTGDERERETTGRKVVRWSRETYQAWAGSTGAFYLLSIKIP